MNDRERNGRVITDSEVLRRVLDVLEAVEPSSRERILQTVHTFFGIPTTRPSHSAADGWLTQTVEVSGRPQKGPSFSEDRTISPKEFLMEKRPQTDVDKVACLAYYLTHYQNVENFKTLDISKLNTDAAQIKFSNAAQAVDNASKAGFLIGGAKGHKKLSAIGELYVQALPDRAAAREAVAHGKPKRRRTKD